MGTVPSITSVLPRVCLCLCLCLAEGPWAGGSGRGQGVLALLQHCPRAAPAVGTPSHPLSAGRSLDRLDSVEILLPPKFPTWEEEYNQISDSVNESSCINQVRC